jgi:Na+/proline symporter
MENLPQITHPDFGAANYAVLVLYLLGMLGIGFYCSRKIKSAKGFFIAEGKLNGTYLSALTMMALSGLAFGDLDMTWTVQLPFLILTAFVITKFVLPAYREAGVISVYEYLEQKIHVSSRIMAAICFCLFSVARMGIVLYLPALAFHIITGFSLPTTIVIMGVVITIYTVIGGIEAVVWTDAIQVILFSVAAVFTIFFIMTGMGDANFGEIAKEHDKFRTGTWTS